MDKLSLEEQLHLLLLRHSIRAKKGLITLAESHGLNGMQALTICLLEPKISVPMHSISTMLVCDASNVTGIVDKLVGNAYIERKESPTDRRVNTITLTAKGEKLRKTFIDVINKEYIAHIATFSTEEKELLKKLLETTLQ